jgi:DNA invertase Pin-like site-specific DNA recombinase
MPKVWFGSRVAVCRTGKRPPFSGARTAEFERRLMLERQREGIAAAKAAGKYKGRAPTARAKAEQIRELDAQGVDRAEIARRLEIGRTSVYRVLAATGQAA